MATEFIPFAQMTTAQKREHLSKAHGFEDWEIQLVADKMHVVHKEEHRKYDGGPEIRVPHAHTKVARRTKR